MTGRQFKIWFISTCVVVAAFALYKMFGDTGNIQRSKTEYQQENRLLNDVNSGQIGPAKVEYVEHARFETIDPGTRKLKRVVGFEKVLHKAGDLWELEKPYMNVYQENIRCDITGDKGIVELENLQGANPTPKQAIMKGNVVVHVFGQGKRADSFIYLDEVAFDSDRSMLWSNDDVNFVSEEADLVGKGLEIVYNNSTNRLEFLKIKKVDYLNIKELPEKTETEKTVKAESNKTETAPKPSATASADKPQTAASDTNKPSKPGVKSKPGQEPKETADKKEEEYRCLFRDNVRIEYKEEVILADEIWVTNLLWSQKDKQKQPEAEKPKPVSKKQAEPEQKRKIENPLKSVNLTASANAEIAIQVPPTKSMQQPKVIATVKCDGPMIIRPVATGDYEERKPAPFKGFNDLNKELRETLGQRNLLIAEKIDYNIATETADTSGQVELVFYPQIQTDAGRQKVPFIISANDGAQFSGPKSQVTFSGDVKGVFAKQTEFYNEENIFHGSKLIADLAEKQDSDDIMASSDLSHITILGPNVRLESIRTLDNTKLSHVRLKSERIDYDRTTEDIIATGNGIIEYSSTSKALRPSSEQTKLDKPCFTLVEGFTKLVWDTNTMHVRATSDETAGIHIGYLPILDTGYGPRTTIDTKQIDIEYFEPIAGKSQLKKLKATGGIVYNEQGGNEFAGKELIYNPADDYMTISGTDEMPCMLNGVFTEGIEYNPSTGSATAVLSSGVGIMPVKE